MMGEESKRLKRCIYLGGIYTTAEILANRAVSPAGDRWQRGFLGGLVRQCEEVVLLSHRQERVFPFGRIVPGCEGLDWARDKTYSFRYFNLPVVRAASLTRGYVRALDRAVGGHGRDTVIVCYNASRWSSLVARTARERYGMPTVCLHLDFPEIHGDWSGFTRLAGEFSGNVFCSHGAFVQSPVGNKFHLDGGFTRATVRQRLSAPAGPISYAGNIADGKGVAKLVACFRTLPDKDLRLHLFGKVDARDGGPRILRSCAEDRRIVYRGVVGYEELEEALSTSSALVNPVDVQAPGNPLNFPSKLHHYLEMGPPVVSAMAEGVAPAYRELIYSVEHDDDQAEWRRRMTEAVQEPAGERQRRIGRVEEFLREHSWGRQVAHLVDWMESWLQQPTAPFP